MPSLIELNDIHFAYPAHAPVLHGASLVLEEGERVSLTGANGAGKSTLLRIAVGLLKPSKGDVCAFGQERRKEKDFHEVRRLVGYVFQDPDDQLFCPTVAEDIAFGPLNLGKSRDEAMAIVDDVLDRLHLSNFHDRITHKLSGGEKRLVTLAAVLAMNPKVLLLDEPSNALDESVTERLLEILNALPQSMILVSHDPHFRRRLETRRLHLREGQITTPPEAKCKHAASS